MLVIDAQLPPSLVTWFQDHGMLAEHVGPLMGDPAAADETIWQLARKPGWVILTKDQDFVDRAMVFGPPPVVIHLNLGNCSNQKLKRHLEQCWPVVSILLQQPGAAIITIDWQAIGLRKANHQL